MAQHRPRKPAPAEYSTDEEDMIVYDVAENEFESNPDYISHYGESLGVQKGKSKCSQSKASESGQSWIRYVSSLTSSTSSKQLCKKVKAANGMYREFSFPILQISDSVFSSPVEIANILGETFHSVSSAASYNSRFLEIKRQAERTPINFSTRSFHITVILR
ncbi:RNase H domain-containing protein [Trichonephila clavipes]|nr:RNase H domain-containing protein [Trichonephila clavipes]